MLEFPFKKFSGKKTRGTLCKDRFYQKFVVPSYIFFRKQQQSSITNARKNDQSFRGHLEKIDKGALYLHDLGYFRLKSFKEIEAAGGYFISRHFSQTSAFEENDKPLNLVKTLRKAGLVFSKNVYLGKQDKGNRIKVRLTATLLPKNEYEKRMSKIEQEAKKKGRVTPREIRELAKWSIYITNVPEDMLKDDQIHLVYTIR